MYKIFAMLAITSISISQLFAQVSLPPDKVYGRLFVDVQTSGIFPDSKTFVDCIPKKNPQEIVANYEKIIANPAIRFSLKMFVESNFVIPKQADDAFQSNKQKDVKEHITNLWAALKRKQDALIEGSSLLPLPQPYIVPGGRFREVYYWDSYFTMLGLKESNEWQTIENMVDNFSYLIANYGHIPNGNRTYYLSRSQPPFFALMVQLLAEKKGNIVYATYKNALQAEYDYWMDKKGTTKHKVSLPNGIILNRYYDKDDVPRQESYIEDSKLISAFAAGKAAEIARDLRSGAESGWDFSTRWFADGKNLATIQTTNIIPVDLNCLLYQLELTLAKAYQATGDLLTQKYYTNIAEKRKKAINQICWNSKWGFYADYKIRTKIQSSEKTLAGATPLFFGIADAAKAKSIAATIQKEFLQSGGLITTLKNSGQQWDAPNGWAPLQYMVIDGLDKNGQQALAKNIAERWVALNIKTFHETGKLMEKYDVVNKNAIAGGGEYPGQDGFGWTNGVLLSLMQKYGYKDAGK